LGGKPAAYYQKIRKDPKEFRANTALGAEEKFLKVSRAPEGMKKEAVKAAKVLGLEVTGVDFLIDDKTGKRYLLEANRGPGFTNPSPEMDALASFFTAWACLPKSKRCH